MNTHKRLRQRFDAWRSQRAAAREKAARIAATIASIPCAPETEGLAYAMAAEREFQGENPHTVWSQFLWGADAPVEEIKAKSSRGARSWSPKTKPPGWYGRGLAAEYVIPHEQLDEIPTDKKLPRFFRPTKVTLVPSPLSKEESDAVRLKDHFVGLELSVTITSKLDLLDKGKVTYELRDDGEIAKTYG